MLVGVHWVTSPRVKRGDPSLLFLGWVPAVAAALGVGTYDGVVAGYQLSVERA